MTAAKLRWARTPQDFDRIAAIDKLSFDNPLSRLQLRGVIQQHNVFCRVVELDSQIVSYAILRLEKSLCEILRLATAEAYRCEGHAGTLLCSMKTESYWRRIHIAVPTRCWSMIRLAIRHGFAYRGLCDAGHDQAAVFEFQQQHLQESAG